MRPHIAIPVALAAAYATQAPFNAALTSLIRSAEPLAALKYALRQES